MNWLEWAGIAYAGITVILLTRAGVAILRERRTGQFTNLVPRNRALRFCIRAILLPSYFPIMLAADILQGVWDGLNVFVREDVRAFLNDQ